MSNVFDIEKFRHFQFQKKKKRGRPSKKDKLLSAWPIDLKIEVSYYCHIQDKFINFYIAPGEDIFNLKGMLTTEYKKFMIELMLKVTAEMCMDDPAMICELQEWLEDCFMKREVEENE